MKSREKLHALAGSLRLPNLPSVVSNVFLGVAIAMLAAGRTDIPWAAFAPLAGAGISFYAAGNLLNDWADREWDARHRPERPLPRGVFAPRFYLILATLLVLCGHALAWATHVRCLYVSACLMAVILLYTWLHKRSAWSVIPMGWCRGLLPVLGFVSVHPLQLIVWPSAFALTSHIAGLSLSARHESSGRPPGGIVMRSGSLFFLTVILMTLEIHWRFHSRTLAPVGWVPYLGWIVICLTRLRRPVSAMVSGLLAGIPLVEWILLLPAGIALSMNEWSPLALACLLASPLAFAACGLLQRVVPAT